MLLAEELLLLSLDPASGRSRVSGDHGTPALVGALLAELVLAGRLTITPDSAGWRERRKVRLLAPGPCGDPELDHALERASAREGRLVDPLMQPSFSSPGYQLRGRLLERLAAAGVVERRDTRLLGLTMPFPAWPVRDQRPQLETRRRLEDAASGRVLPDPRTLALLGVAHGSRTLRRLLPGTDRTMERRVAVLVAGDPLAAAVRRVVNGSDSSTAATAAT